MKKLLLLATTTLISASTYASDLTLTSEDLTLQLLGRFNFQGGYLKQSKVPGISNKVSTYRNNFAFNTNAFTAVKITAEQEELKYGAVLSLSTSTRGTGSNSYERSHIFLEGNAGKFEAGSNWSSNGKMSVSAFDLARATGDDSENYAGSIINAKDSNLDLPGDINAPMYPSFFLDKPDKNNGELSRKVTYYTPEFNGFQIGVSYIPDTGNLGGVSLRDASDDYNTATTYKTTTTDAATGIVTDTTYSEKQPIRDAYSVGLAFKHDVSEDVSFKLAATGEYGKPANSGDKTVVITPAAVVGGAPVVATTTNTKYKLAKLNTYNIGGVFSYGNYSLGGSYGNLGKSMTSAEVLGSKRGTKYYTAGASYVQGPVGISLVYSKAKQFGNNMDIYTIGTDYKLAPGLLPYAEVAFFNGKAGLPDVYKSKVPKQKFKGFAVIAGMKLMF